EWRRVTRPGGRLSLSVPGPMDVLPPTHYREVYRRHGVKPRRDVPDPDALVDVARAAGWRDVRVEPDPETAIVLPDEDAFRTWYEIGPRGPVTAGFSPDQHAALCAEMLAVTPRDAEGRYRIPFGAIYLTAVA